MQLHHFVSGMSVILVGWLAVTFFHQVPSQRYPKLQKYSMIPLKKPETTAERTTLSPETGELAVSASH